ncbi:hypothetical protein HUW51_08885 [Adhaeribacter swui]|uniref:Uncharacterized protein n=1 Tax=Adhaeribacter swui TaxID=2086471 RepID=A0A7G7G6Q7_9BACT|nr:hypothetical protein [Adhaeribacter swui]QNF32841.1 hypothetical protein HUW51_08885 [Adhaeribacter swui]
MPQNTFAHSYHQTSGFSLTDLSGGKINGLFRKFHSNGKLIIEQEIKDNIAAGKRKIHYPTFQVDQVWENDVLISTDTIQVSK